MTAHLTLYLARELVQRFGVPAVTHQLLGRIQKTPKSALRQCVERYGIPGGACATS